MGHQLLRRLLPRKSGIRLPCVMAFGCAGCILLCMYGFHLLPSSRGVINRVMQTNVPLVRAINATNRNDVNPLNQIPDHLDLLPSSELIRNDISTLHHTAVPCTPTINLSYIKIHRTGSGMLHNTLVKFAIKHNAFVALGDCTWYEVFPYQISNELLLPPPRHPTFHGYNMFIDHVIFNRTASDEVLSSGTVYFTQIRHPFAHGFSYYSKLTWGRSYKQVLSNPAKYERTIQTGGLCPHAKTPRMKVSPSRNGMALELGYTKQAEKNVSNFEVFLKKLDSELLHVSILEELPASMVLLRHKLCWKFQDILHLKLHATGDGKPTKDTELLRKQQKTHREWSSVDYVLYEYFLERHKKEVAAQPPSFHEEIEEYVRVQEEFTAFCGTICDELVKADKTNITQMRHIMMKNITFPITRFYDSFSVSLEDCAMHILNEEYSKKALKYHMYHHSCGKDTKLISQLKVDCNVNFHVIPGLSVKDIKPLFNKNSCKPFRKKN